MKNGRYVLILFIFSGLLFISAAHNSPTVESEISQFVDLFVKKWNQHDLKELNELWGENGDLMNLAGLDHDILYLLVKQNNHWRILAVRPYQFLELHLGLFESPHALNKVLSRNNH